jgi:hypothetical protein
MRQTRRHLVPLDTMMKHWRWKRLEAHMPAAVPRLLERITYRPIERGSVPTEDAVDYLREVLAPKSRELSLLLGREFPEWNL